MTIKRCDNCKKRLHRDNSVYVMPGRDWDTIDLCTRCGDPVLEILKKYDVLKDSWGVSLRKKSSVV